GHVHMGFMREIIIGDAIQRLLKKKRKEVNFRIFIDSYDAAKRFPPYIDKSYADNYVGQPFALIPSPFNDIEASSYAEYFGKELINTFPDFGVDIETIWTHSLYQHAEMHEQIRIGLQKADEVKKIVLTHLTHAMSDSEKAEKYEDYEQWMPAMVVCESCNRTQIKNSKGEISPNRIVNYDQVKDTVTYICPACEYSGEVKISSGLVKLNWRLDWPAKWALNPKNVYEGSGKDHFTKITGSWDVATDLCHQIYGYEGPVGLGFEWVRLGDSDMGTSKGVVFMPKTYLSMAEPELLRMIFLTTNPSRHVSFRIEELSLLYDEYERIERIYYQLEEPFDLKKKLDDYSNRLQKALTKELEKEALEQFSLLIRNEQDIEKRKLLAKNKKGKIEEMVNEQFSTRFTEQLEKYKKSEEAEYSRQRGEIEFLYPLIRAKNVKKECPPQIPHKFLVNMVQLRKYISFEEILNKAQQTQEQKQIPAIISKSYMKKRLQQTENWLNHIKTLIEETEDAQEKIRIESKVDLFDVPKTVSKATIGSFDEKQLLSLKEFSSWLNQIDEFTEENLKNSMIQIRDKTRIDAKNLFQAIYMVLIGRSVGPRLGPFMTLMDLKWIRKRFSVFGKK
ncbi:MAG: lysine--tRNA ligase, partial [Promethearchaeota archaeon]